MPRYVVLEHDHPSLHWDLMLERDGVLKTWRLAELPGGHERPIAAESSFDHRLLYLDYEGPVSGDRGQVMRRDRGTYTLIEDKEESLTIQFTGEHLSGVFALVRAEDGMWTFQ